MKKEQNQPPKRVNPYTGFLGSILILLLLNGLIMPSLSGNRIVTTDYGTFVEKVDSGLVKEVAIKSNQIYFITQEKDKEITYQTGEANDPQLVDRLLHASSPNDNGKIEFTQIVPRENSPLLDFLLMWILPGLLFYIL